MNQSLTVLHITDFHINLPDKDIELLNKENYKKYLSGLIESIKKQYSKIDCIIATGDFVDIGKIENFNHAETILMYLAENLQVPIENIGICIGNHDIKKIDNKDDKSAFTEFSNKFPSVNNAIVRGTESDNDNLFYLSKFSGLDNVYYISLDSTFNRDGGKPGRLTPQITNSIFKKLKEFLPDHPNNTIIIGSHYPMTIFFEEALNDENFFNYALWQSGMPFFGRLKATYSQSKLLWLCGDLHYSDYISEEYGRSIAILGGRIGTKFPDSEILRKLTEKEDENLSEPEKKELLEYKKAISVQQRMVTVIEYPQNKDINFKNFVFKFSGYNESIQGIWDFYNAKNIRYSFNVPEVINEELEKIIFDHISGKNNNLYKFGRFDTREKNEVTLGWVSLNPLLGNITILKQIISRSKEYIDSILTEEEKTSSKSILFGVDFWDSIITSQLSVLTGIKNHCRASTSKDIDDSYIEPEKFCQGLNIEDEENLVFITDVLSTGRTLKEVYEKVKQYFDLKDKKIKKVIVISVLCDKNQDRKVKLDFVHKLGTCCSIISIPVIDKENLPNDELSPPQKIYY